MENILTRRSIRKYDLTKKVSREDLLKLCEAGLAAPSARNQQPTSFIIIDDEEVIKQLATVSRGAGILSNCNTVIAVVGDEKEKLSVPQMETQDLACATENIMLAARTMNLGTCYVGIYPVDDRMESMKKILNIPKDKIAFSLIAVGYPLSLDEFKKVERMNSEKVRYNRY